MCALLPWLRRCLHSRAKGWGAYLFSPTAGPRPRTRERWNRPHSSLSPSSPPEVQPSPRPRPLRRLSRSRSRLSCPFPAPPPTISRATRCRSVRVHAPAALWLAAESRRGATPTPLARPSHSDPVDRFISGAIPSPLPPSHPLRAKFLCPTGVARKPSSRHLPYPIFPVHGGGEAPASGEITWPGADLTSFPPRLLMDLSPWTGTFRGDSWLGGKWKWKLMGNAVVLLLRKGNRD